jgi:hypothetical protein
MSRFIGRSWADMVEEDEEENKMMSLDVVHNLQYEAQDVLSTNTYITEESYANAFKRNLQYEAQDVLSTNTYITEESYANALKRNLPYLQDKLDEPSENLIEPELTTDTLDPGDPVGIRTIQSILMSATQMSLSHFHTAGMDNVVTVRLQPSAADAMNSTYTKNNTSMTFESIDDVYTIRKQLVGANLIDFVTAVKIDATGFPDRENIWYEALGKKMYDESGEKMYKGSILRIYINYNKMRNHGLTLEDLAREVYNTECIFHVSPDFMGMIDLEIPDQYLSQWLAKTGKKVCGTLDIKSCNKINEKTAITVGSNVLAVSKLHNVDKTTINSNNVLEVFEHYGIEAAASVLASLTGSQIVSDFMARTGKVLYFMKNSVEVTNKGLLTSMGFERPRDDVKRTLISKQNNLSSVYESIITGSKNHDIFELDTKKHIKRREF